MVGSTQQQQQQQQQHEVASNSSDLPPPPRFLRVKRPDRPNKPAFMEQIGLLEGQIDALQVRIKEIKELLDTKLQNRHAASPETVSARNRLAELNELFKQSLEAKKIHRQELDVVKEKLREDSRSGSGIPHVKVEQMDEEMKQLEYRQTHTTLHIDEEKKLLQQFAKLKKTREALLLHEVRVEQDLESRSRLVELIKEDDVRLNSLKAQQEEQRLLLAEIRDREIKLTLDVPALVQEKNASYQKIKALREEIRQLKLDFAATEDEFWKKEREWRAQQAADMKVKNEKVREERLEREKVRKQRALENFVEPYTVEIILCEQLMSYMQKIAPEEGEALPQSKQKPEVLASAGFGDVLVSKKNRSDDDLEGWFVGSGSKKGGKKSKASAPQKNKSKEKISLSLDALSSFQKMKVLPPTTCSDVPKKIEEIQKRKNLYLEMQRKARENREGGEKEIIVLSAEEEALASGSETSFQNGSHMKQESLHYNGGDILNLNESMFPPLHSVCNDNAHVEIYEEKVENPDLADGEETKILENGVVLPDSGDEVKIKTDILQESVGEATTEISQDSRDEAKIEVLPDSGHGAELLPDSEYLPQPHFAESETGVIVISETLDLGSVDGPGVGFSENTDLIVTEESTKTIDPKTGYTDFEDAFEVIPRVTETSGKIDEIDQSNDAEK